MQNTKAIDTAGPQTITSILWRVEEHMAEQRRGPAVIEHELTYTSVSALQTFRRCNRMWRWAKVEHVPGKPQSKGQVRGEQGHAQVSHFLQTGQNAMGSLEALAFERKLLPPPSVGVLSEVSFEEGIVPLKIDGVPLVGYIDVLDLNTRTVTDLKFSVDPEKWGSKDQDLVDPNSDYGLQLLVYAKWFTLNHGPGPVKLQHVTYRTRGAPDVFLTQNVVGDDLEERMAPIAALVPQMKLAARAESAMDVTPNYDRCHDFGGCAYFDRCHSTTQRLLAGFTGGNMGLFKELAAKNGTTQIDLAALATPKAVGVVPPDAPANAAAPPPIYTGPVRPRHEFDPENSTTIAWTCRCSASFNSQNGLAAHLQELAAKTTPIVLEPAQALALAPAVNPPEGGIASATWPGKGEPTGPDAEGPAPTPKKRARPKAPDTTLPQAGAILSPQAPPPSASIGAPLDSPTPGVTPSAPKAEAGTSSDPRVAPSVRIFLNCFPNAPTTSLLPYIEQLQKDICAVAKLPDTDFRCVDTKPLNFGAWQGYLASAVKLLPPPPGSYSASSGDARVAVVISALEGILPAGSVVKGVA